MPRLVEPPHGPVPVETASNGCFETMRAYRGRIFRLEPHLDRLYASAQFLGTHPPANRRALSAQLKNALERSGVSEAVVRVALLPQRVGEARPSIVVQPAVLPPIRAYRRGLRVAIVPTRSMAQGAVTPQAKYSARLGSVMAILDAQLRRADEVLFMDVLGYVTESTASNFGIIKRGVIVTPPCWSGLLAGITRDVLWETAHRLRLPLQEVPLTRHDVYNADEAFLSSTLKEVMPITIIDGRRIGSGRPGPVARRLRRAFQDLVKRELKLSHV